MNWVATDNLADQLALRPFLKVFSKCHALRYIDIKNECKIITQIQFKKKTKVIVTYNKHEAV